MSCWVCWECLLSAWTIVLFFKAAHHSAAGYLISPPPCRWKTHPDNTLQCFVLLLDFLSDLVFAVTFKSHQDGSTLKPHGPSVEVSLQFGGNRFFMGRKGEAQQQLSISVHRSRSCSLAGCEKFHFFSACPFCLTWSCAWALDLCLVP